MGANKDATRRVAMAGLAGFATLLVGIPVSCIGWQMYYAHAAPVAPSSGPASLLGGMAVAAFLGMAVALLVFVRSGRR